MASLDEAAERALAFPGVSEGERWHRRTWLVNQKAFAWERPFSKADLKRFGDATPPSGPILAVTVADLGEKEALLAEGHPGFFTIEHFDNYPAVLIQLTAVSEDDLTDALTQAWLCCAPPAVAERYLAAD